MEKIIIQPKDKAELNFFLEPAKRPGVTIKTYDEVQDENLLIDMEENRKTEKTNKKKVMDTLLNILNEDRAHYENEG